MGRKEFIIRQKREFELSERFRISRMLNEKKEAEIAAKKTQPKPAPLPPNIQQLINKADPMILRLILDRETLIRLGIPVE